MNIWLLVTSILYVGALLFWFICMYIYLGVYMWIDLHATVYLVYEYENTCIDLFVKHIRTDGWFRHGSSLSMYLSIHPIYLPESTFLPIYNYLILFVCLSILCLWQFILSEMMIPMLFVFGMSGHQQASADLIGPISVDLFFESSQQRFRDTSRPDVR